MAAEKAVALQLMLHIVQLCIDLVFLAIFQPDQQYIAAALNKFDLPIGDAAAPAALPDEKGPLPPVVLLPQKTLPGTKSGRVS